MLHISALALHEHGTTDTCFQRAVYAAFANTTAAAAHGIIIFALLNMVLLRIRHHGHCLPPCHASCSAFGGRNRFLRHWVLFVNVLGGAAEMCCTAVGGEGLRSRRDRQKTVSLCAAWCRHKVLLVVAYCEQQHCCRRK